MRDARDTREEPIAPLSPEAIEASKRAALTLFGLQIITLTCAQMVRSRVKRPWTPNSWMLSRIRAAA